MQQRDVEPYTQRKSRWPTVQQRHVDPCTLYTAQYQRLPAVLQGGTEPCTNTTSQWPTVQQRHVDPCTLPNIKDCPQCCNAVQSRVPTQHHSGPQCSNVIAVYQHNITVAHSAATSCRPVYPAQYQRLPAVQQRGTEPCTNTTSHPISDARSSNAVRAVYQHNITVAHSAATSCRPVYSPISRLPAATAAEPYQHNITVAHSAATLAVYQHNITVAHSAATSCRPVYIAQYQRLPAVQQRGTEPCTNTTSHPISKTARSAATRYRAVYQHNITVAHSAATSCRPVYIAQYQRLPAVQQRGTEPCTNTTSKWSSISDPPNPIIPLYTMPGHSCGFSSSQYSPTPIIILDRNHTARNCVNK
ncbi:hypothetical protein J6590_039103 [Homalodisca vitripennis]|nr:hypothetical protein J6590_039103 [Homalodisca vitripennis]